MNGCKLYQVINKLGNVVAVVTMLAEMLYRFNDEQNIDVIQVNSLYIRDTTPFIDALSVSLTVECTQRIE